MKLTVWALGALVGIFALAACGTETEAPIPFSAAQAATITARELAITDVEKELGHMKLLRDAKSGWAAEVQPGDRRTTREVEESLSKFAMLQKRLEDAGSSEKVSALRRDIHTFMTEDTKMLLRKARVEQDIWALGAFVRYAKGLNVSLEKDFNVTSENLRTEALVMARKKVLELRPRIKEESGDAIGGLLDIYNEWGFTPQDLGLTVEEVKLVTESR